MKFAHLMQYSFTLKKNIDAVSIMNKHITRLRIF